MNADLVMTVEEMKDEKKWLEVRNTGLGGSDAATVALCEIEPYPISILERRYPNVPIYKIIMEVEKGGHK